MRVPPSKPPNMGMLEAMLGHSKLLKALNAAYYTIVAGLIVTVLYQSWNLGSFYLTWPTYMQTQIMEQMQADFPALTVCKLDPCERGDGQERNCTGQSLIVLSILARLSRRLITLQLFSSTLCIRNLNTAIHKIFLCR